MILLKYFPIILTAQILLSLDFSVLCRELLLALAMNLDAYSLHAPEGLKCSEIPELQGLLDYTVAIL